MTLPDQPQPGQGPADDALLVPDLLAREVEVIAIDSLDKENRGWTVKYVDGLRQRLADEQAADQPDLVMISYLKRELATYDELLGRTEGKK
jgi:hypothetical protein